MHVERWCDSRLPQAAGDVLREVLHEVGEPAHELAATLDVAASATSLTFLAIAKRRPVGVLIATPQTRLGATFIRWLAVAPNARRSGVGTALVEAIARTPRVWSLTGMVDQEDPAAFGFWRDRGWQVRKPRPGRRRQLMHAKMVDPIRNAT